MLHIDVRTCLIVVLLACNAVLALSLRVLLEDRRERQQVQAQVVEALTTAAAKPKEPQTVIPLYEAEPSPVPSAKPKLPEVKSEK
jgi:hypothetical protein